MSKNKHTCTNCDRVKNGELLRAFVTERIGRERFFSLFREDEANMEKVFRGKARIKGGYLMMMKMHDRISDLESLLEVAAPGKTFDQAMEELRATLAETNEGTKKELCALKRRLRIIEQANNTINNALAKEFNK